MAGDSLESLALYAAVAVAGVLAGFINSMAGGGSLLTLPILMLLGLPATVANGTNRLAVLCQAVAGVLAYRRHGRLPRRGVAPTVLPTAFGAAIGASLAAYIPEWLLKYILIAIMIAMAVLMVARPQLMAAPESDEPLSRRRRWAASLSMLAVGIYGGFVQAGVGILLLAVLTGISRYDLLRANALKLMCTALFGTVALAIFAAAGQVEWLAGAVLALFSIFGALVGVRFAVRAGHTTIRWIVLACVVATCIAALVRA
ncbi:MAG: sulfite exporter TauE/SafE family protein [Myxococcota bacterium]